MSNNLQNNGFKEAIKKDSNRNDLRHDALSGAEEKIKKAAYTPQPASVNFRELRSNKATQFIIRK